MPAGRVYGGLTAQERLERRREQLLDAGLEVFARDGWHGARVADVCRAAGLSPRSFYELFADREALFLAVTDRLAERVLALLRPAATAPGQTPDERVRGVLAALAGFFADDPRAVRVALVESCATPALRAHRARLLRSFAEVTARLMRSLHPAPERADARALEISALVLTGGVAEALMAAAGGEPSAPAGELVAHLAALYAAAAQVSAR
ncbi:MAG TPA: TetR/AcrR family transcriptional regulator [Capillimicrobium sp.]